MWLSQRHPVDLRPSQAALKATLNLLAIDYCMLTFGWNVPKQSMLHEVWRSKATMSYRKSTNSIHADDAVLFVERLSMITTWLWVGASDDVRDRSLGHAKATLRTLAPVPPVKFVYRSNGLLINVHLSFNIFATVSTVVFPRPVFAESHQHISTTKNA